MIYFDWVDNLKKLEVAPMDDSIIKKLEDSSFDGTKYTLHKLMLHISDTANNRLRNCFQKFMDKFFNGLLLNKDTWSIELVELKKEMEFSKRIINLSVLSLEQKKECLIHLNKFINDVISAIEKMMISIDTNGEYNSIFKNIMMNNKEV